MKRKRIILLLGLLSCLSLFSGQRVLATDLRPGENESLDEVMARATANDTILIDDGEEYTLTGATTGGQAAIKVTNGKLIFNGASLTNTKGIRLDGPQAQGTFISGSIKTSPREVGLYLKNGASIDTIGEGMTIYGHKAAMILESRSSIGQIQGGTFANGPDHSASNIAIGAVVGLEDASIGEISGGTFTSVHDAALYVGKGSKIGTLSGGTYQSNLSTTEYKYIPAESYRYNYFSALVLYTKPSSSGAASIDKITGGDFQGLHALYMVSGTDQGKVQIGEISGGTFENIEDIPGLHDSITHDTLLASQRAYIDKISGGLFKAGDADAIQLTINLYNGGPRGSSRIQEISGGKFFATGDGHAILLNYADHRIDLISGGEFVAGSQATYALESKDGRKGTLGKVTGGAFWGGIKMQNDKNNPTLIEPDLSQGQPDMGLARYYHKKAYSNPLNYYDKAFFNGSFSLPTYQTDQGLTYSYTPSVYSKDYGVFESGSIGFYEDTTDTDLNPSEYFFWSSMPYGYFDTVNKEAYYTFKGNDSSDFDAYDRKDEKIYGLYPAYDDPASGLKEVSLEGYDPSSQKMGYLRKRPVLKFAANLPQDLSYTGQLPKDQHILPFAWDPWDNEIPYDPVGDHWEGVFLVPKTPGIQAQGYRFLGWNTQADGKGRNLKLDKFYAMPLEDLTLYAQWEAPEEPSGPNLGHNTGHGTSTKDHQAYLIGYTDQTFRPKRSMSREEVTVMFARLLEDPTNQEAPALNFSDVGKNRWSAQAIEKAARCGIIKGYPDGTFKPDRPISRAEFLAMATRFQPLDPGIKSFEDVPPSHWAYDLVKRGASAGWVEGYPSGDFQPDESISRAEVAKISNFMLSRKADKDFVHHHQEEMLCFPDVPENYWAYDYIEEACNSHRYKWSHKEGEEEVWKQILDSSMDYTIYKKR
ncbi:MAG: S-layer homology domain-containing protein [Tissierellia bacterium]|nr:S-layer homology domain-containing protein [Tissierellia bacterium]